MATDNGPIVKVVPTKEGTGKRGVPTAIALKSKKTSKPASANPDGQGDRARGSR